MTRESDLDNESDDAPKLKGLAWLGFVLALGAALALGMAPLIRATPWRWEKKLADSMTTEDGPETCHGDPDKNKALQLLVGRLYPVQPDDNKFSITVHVARSSVVNAYAELGGNVTINSALLAEAQSPEEVAGVLAHEIGHVHHRDVLQGFASRMLTSQGLKFVLGDDGPNSDADWANYFLTMSFSRAQERHADADGLRRLQKAHIDNTGFRRFFERMENEESAPAFLSDHPSNESRGAMVKEFGNEGATPVMSHADWLALKHYCR